MTEPLLIEPLNGPLAAVVSLPGSKSITNRALVCAALAGGSSHLRHALEADDTYAMVAGLQALGVEVDAHWNERRIEVQGCAGRPMADAAIVDARLSGTTARFLLPLAALGAGHRRVDGSNRMRERPMADAIAAARALGAEVAHAGAPGHLPVDLVGGSLVGGEISMRGDASSQFLSGLLLAAPAMPRGLTVHINGPLVSRPYVTMTTRVMAAFGVDATQPDPVTWAVAPQLYRGTDYVIEPDASAASYVFAAAVIVGGSVRVRGLGAGALQGDLAFVDLLERMGARVDRSGPDTVVASDGPLRGIDVEMSDISDTAQTLAVVAAFADGPTTIRGIGFIRGKETNRIEAVVTELRRLGINAEEQSDGLVVRPGPLRPGLVQTYDDHRMAMAFALVGLRVPGVQIADPGCVTKTFPGYWRLLDELRGSGTGTMVLPA